MHSFDTESGILKSSTELIIYEARIQYLSGLRLALVILGLCLAVLLIGLDNSIISTGWGIKPVVEHRAEKKQLFQQLLPSSILWMISDGMGVHS